MTTSGPILSRAFEVQGPDGNGLAIRLEVFAPQLWPARPGDWECEYRLYGAGFGDGKKAYGIDSMQALLLALRRAEIEIEGFASVSRSRVTWLEGDDLGFPLLKETPGAQSDGDA